MKKLMSNKTWKKRRSYYPEVIGLENRVVMTVFVEQTEIPGRENPTEIFASGINAEIDGEVTINYGYRSGQSLRDQTNYIIKLNQAYNGVAKLTMSIQPPSLSLADTRGGNPYFFLAFEEVFAGGGGYPINATIDDNTNSLTFTFNVTTSVTEFSLQVDGVANYIQAITPAPYNITISGSQNNLSPQLPDITTGMLSLNTSNTIINSFYSISGNDLPGSSTISYYWATGPNFSNRIGTTPAEVATAVQSETSPYEISEPIASLGAKPANAIYILEVADSPDLAPDKNPNGLILESNENNNVSSLIIPKGDVSLDSTKLVYSTKNSSSTTTFTYHTINDPEAFDVGLYQSPTANFDASTNKLISSQVVTQLANSSGVGSFVLTFAPNPLLPFILIVINPENFLAQSNGSVHELPVYLVSVSQLHSIITATPLANLQADVAPLNEALEEFQIDTPSREAAFLSQIFVESTDVFTHIPLTAFEEEAPKGVDPVSYFDNKYNGSNGNIPGTDDGYDFRGGGPIMLTGRANYTAAQNFFGFSPSIVITPSYVSQNLQVSFRTSAWFYAIQSSALTKVLYQQANLNLLADTFVYSGVATTSNPFFQAAANLVNNEVTRVLNGPGRNSLVQRLAYFENSYIILINGN